MSAPGSSTDPVYADCDCFLCRRARQDDVEIAETFNAFRNRYAKQYGTLVGVDEAYRDDGHE